ncbi:MAG: PAS domain S-box protein [Peptococcaceae bacterium]|nr:PAS domain S-box protein [Peptococcaceae bacterium]
MDNINDGLLVLDREGKIEFVNQKLCQMLGYKAEELIGQDWRLIIHPQYIPNVQREMEQCKKGQPGRYECCLRLREGKDIPCLISAARRSGPGGEFQGCVTIITDITGLKIMERELRESEEKYKTIMKNSSDGMIIYRSEDYKLVEVNQALADMLERTIEECLQLKIPDTLHPESHGLVMDYVKRRAGGDPTVPTHYIHTAVTKSGKKRYWHTGVCRLDCKPGHVSVVVRDITDIMQMEEDLRRQNQALQEKLAETRILRNKLSRYQEQIRQLFKRTMEIEEKSRRRLAIELHDGAVQEIASALHRIKICQTLLKKDPEQTWTEMAIMRETLQRGMQELRRAIYNLRPLSLDFLGLLPTLKDYLQKFQAETGISVTLKVSGTEKELFPERAVAVFRIIQEALRNVQKHARAGNVLVTIAYGPKQLRVTLVDDGCGFSREDEVRAIKNGCVGLIGMKERAQLMSGVLRVRSATGKGTRVTLSIPFTVQEVADEQDQITDCR